ncbi:MAG TPA: DUF2971 domain-containing protein [Bryobacteraceae bacterium]|nr:DUF2971 domain-containing protein [Bryobacteraceae bacterium]
MSKQVEPEDIFRRKLVEFDLEMSSARAVEGSDASDLPVLYHYTDSKGLIGILTEGQLWATDIRYLNDSSELRHAEEIQRQILKEIIAESAEGSLEMKLACEALEDRHRPSVWGPYVTCFCAEDNLLTQWKTYGAWGSGFSIGFDRKSLESALTALVQRPPLSLMPSLSLGDDTEPNLARILYSEVEQRRLFKFAFYRYASLLSSDSAQSQIAHCATAIADNAALSASRFKHPGFESEKEWRIIVQSGANLDLSFRPSNRTVIPYIKTEKQPGNRLPIVSITIGPTLDRELSWQSVLMLLIARGYFGDDGHVEIKTSNIPLTRTD